MQLMHPLWCLVEPLPKRNFLSSILLPMGTFVPLLGYSDKKRLEWSSHIQIMLTSYCTTMHIERSVMMMVSVCWSVDIGVHWYSFVDAGVKNKQSVLSTTMKFSQITSSSNKIWCLLTLQRRWSICSSLSHHSSSLHHCGLPTLSRPEPSQLQDMENF